MIGQKRKSGKNGENMEEKRKCVQKKEVDINWKRGDYWKIF